MYLKVKKTDGSIVYGNLDKLVTVQKTQGENSHTYVFDATPVYVSLNDELEVVSLDSIIKDSSNGK